MKDEDGKACQRAGLFQKLLDTSRVRPMPAERFFSVIGDLLYGTIVKILLQGMNTGVFRQLEPRHTAVNIIGACTFYFTAQENLKYLWPGKRLLGKELLQRHTQESIDLIMAGVRN